MKSAKKNVWLWAIAVFVLLTLLTKGAILKAILPIGRFALPAILIYLGYRVVIKPLLSAKSDLTKSRRDESNVIEICPECGHEKKGLVHVCRKEKS